MTTVFVFGDSITYGAWDSRGGWVQRLREFLESKDHYTNNFYWCVYNLGVDGDTTEDVLRRINSEIKSRADKNEKLIFLFSIGANDSNFVISKNRFKTDPKKFEVNIKNLIKISRKHTKHIVFTGFTPVDEKRTNPLAWSKDLSSKNENNKIFDELIKNVCKRERIHFIEVFDKMIKFNYRALLDDGVHPNTDGHAVFFEIVKDYLIKNKIV